MVIGSGPRSLGRQALVFDRAKSYGCRLNVPSGSSIRFEPGDSKVFALHPFQSRREGKTPRRRVLLSWCVCVCVHT